MLQPLPVPPRPPKTIRLTLYITASHRTIHVYFSTLYLLFSTKQHTGCNNDYSHHNTAHCAGGTSETMRHILLLHKELYICITLFKCMLNADLIRHFFF